jgi:glycosyltransferase involved in cell wall biosynthesis
MVPVKNEEFTIDEKIKNIFKCDYPKEKLHILIMDSTSDDDTQRIVSRYISE